MKAWTVCTKDSCYSMIVFAETRGKAISFALSMDGFEDYCFTELVASREKKADTYYTEGKLYMDWEIPQDRQILYDEFTYRCEFVEDFYCSTCPIKEQCEDFQDSLEENNES